jgi:hypothetical protein
MHMAYGARSGVVHGGELSGAKLRGLSGHPATPDEVADDLEELMRRSVRKALRLQASGAGVSSCLG